MSYRRIALAVAVPALFLAGLVLVGAPRQSSEQAHGPLTGPRAKPSSFQIDPDATFAPELPAGIEAVTVPAAVSAPRASFDAPTAPTPSGLTTEGPPEPGAALPAAGTGESLATSSRPSRQAPELRQDPLPRIFPAPPLRRNFDSTDFDTNSGHTGFLFIPPDSHAAAGPDHLVNVVNVTIRTHDKDGTLNLDDSLANFFATVSPANFTFDPKVLYDQFNDRFVVVTLELVDDGTCAADGDCTSRILVAVSDDSDPGGTWFFTAFNSEVDIPVGGTEHWADYPGFAVDEEAVYITTNMFTYTVNGRTFGGVRLWVIDKGLAGGFYDGGVANVSAFDPYSGGGGSIVTTTQPAHIYGSAPSGVGTFLVSHSGLSNTVDEFVQVVRVDDPLGSPTFVQQFVNVGDIDNVTFALPNAPQSGTGTLIAVNDRRALDADWRDGSLWMTATIRPNSGPDSGQTTAFWWEIDTSSLASLTIADQGQIGGEEIAPGAYTFFPAIAVNSANQVAIGFSVSDDSMFASSAYTTRTPADPPGTTREPAILRAGTDFYVRTFGGGSNRWGDYSGMAVDPADDTCFWVYNQHAMARGTPTGAGEDGRWATAYGHVCPEGFQLINADVEPSGAAGRSEGRVEAPAEAGTRR